MNRFKNLLARLLPALVLSVCVPALTFAQSPNGLPPSVSVKPGEGGKHLVTFQYSSPTAALVFLAGTFNEWVPNKDVMNKASGGKFSITVELPDGTHEYKFVENGSDWKSDPLNPEGVDDNNGGKNSVLKLGKGAVTPATASGGTTAPVAASPAHGANTISPFPSVTIEPLGGRQNRVTFRHKAPGASSVALAGSFNGWNTNQNTMAKKGDEFVATLVLPDGEHEYKFVVNGSEWKHDPLNPVGMDDNNGGQNSVLRLGPGAKLIKSDAKPGDGRIGGEMLHHDPLSVEFFNPVGNGDVVVRLRTLANDLEGAMIIRSSGDGTRVSGTALRSVYKDNRFEYFEGRMKNPGKFFFQVSDGVTKLNFGPDGTKTPPASVGEFTGMIDSGSVFVTPEWARRVVWYDIFPERFRNGSKDNDATEGLRAWTSDWDRLMPRDEGKMYPSVFFRRYGGDLQGVIEKLPYLKSLGVGVIWFNPVFQSASLHKYDATDYRHIDDEFGVAGEYAKTAAHEDLLDPATWKFNKSDQVFLDLIRKAHAAGIRIVIDGVFNHTGTKHPAFLDLQKNGKESRFKDWYNVTKWDPLEWEGWYGSRDLPVFKESGTGFTDPAVHKHLMNITRRWMDPNGDGDPSDGIDGWRLDVPNEVGVQFWREWREVVKSVNPDAIIMGEIWDPPKQWLKGDQFDCVMNYQFAKAMTRFFVNNGPASGLSREFSRLLFEIPEQSNYVMMNLMNSHDTDRLVSMLNNPGRDYDTRNRLQDLKPGETYNADKPTTPVYTKMKTLVAAQFCYVGGPMIYYGDEAGMWGPDDPGDRKPTIWKDLEPYEKPGDNHVMGDVFSHFQRCAAIRNTHPALQTGEYEALLADDAKSVFAFRRWDDRQTVVVVSNNSTEPQEVEIPLPATGPKEFVDLLNDPAVKIVTGNVDSKEPTKIDASGAKVSFKAMDGKVRVELEPTSTRILLGR
jgi:glycosidase